MKASELVEALREYALIDECEGGNPVVIATERAAADLIEAQAKAIEELSGFLAWCLGRVEHDDGGGDDTWYSDVAIATIEEGWRAIERAEALASHSQEGEQG